VIGFQDTMGDAITAISPQANQAVVNGVGGLY
jgi:hypothetical protein